MLDIKEIRTHPEAIEKKLQTKEPNLSLRHLLTLDTRVREIKTETEELKAKRNTLSKQIGERKRTGEDAAPLMDEVGRFGDRITLLDHELKAVEAEFEAEMAKLPNLPLDEVPISPSPADNVCIKTHGTKPTFSFTPKNHVELNEHLHLFDFKRGAKLSGTGWPIYKGWGARLEWALLQYMIDTHLKHGFEMYMLPHLVHAEAMFGAGQLPKFESQLFKLGDPDYPLYLIPTGEVPLNGLHYDEILPEEELPKKYLAYTPCFRREAGAAGSKERGLIRVHQFNKVEMYCYTKPEESEQVFHEMLASAERIVEGLGLHYRSMLLVTGDMSFSSAKTVDIEVYLPGQERYYEVSSVSNCTDFQARRSKTRFKRDGKPEFVHTLNGSGVATSRLMVGLLEANQQADGSVLIPEVLRPYLGGQERLLP
ncbi:MAG: serine--tRNA ligase [Parachlamydiales bacterium]